uniref:Uncharacterized protein n=1 Tax=Lotharella globosa TaxID=91324 RepID=A0A7S3ZEK8_9EUKA
MSSLPAVSPYLEKTLVKQRRRPSKPTKFPAVGRPSSQEAKTKMRHDDLEAENAHLRKLLKEYEAANQGLKIENSELRMKLEGNFDPDNNMEYQLNQARMKLEAANRKMTDMNDRVYRIDKAESLMKYWQNQNYEREEELKGTISRYDNLIAAKDNIITQKDAALKDTQERLDFANDKIEILEAKLTKAEDKIVQLTKENEKLTQAMKDLKKACEAQLIAMKKKNDKDLKILDLKAKKKLRQVVKFADEKLNEFRLIAEKKCNRYENQISELKTRTDTYYTMRIVKLIGIIDKLKKEASHTFARIAAAEDLKQAERDIDNLESALQKEQEEHMNDNMKNEQVIEQKNALIKKLEERIGALEKELTETIMAPKEGYERLSAEIMDLNDKYKEKCDEVDRLCETLRLARKEAKEDAEIARYEIKKRDLEIQRLGFVIEDLRQELDRRRDEIVDLKGRIVVITKECERRHHIILAKIKEIGRLEEVIAHVCTKARQDAVKAAAILKHTRKVLKETQDHVKRLKKALEEAIEFGRQQTKKLNVALETIKEKDTIIYKKDVEIVNLEHDVKDGIEENLSLEWNLNKRKQLDSEKNRTIDNQRVEIQELRSALEAIERKIRSNNAKVTRMRAQVRNAEDRVLRIEMELEAKEKEFMVYQEKAQQAQEQIKDNALIQERKLREIIKNKDEMHKEFVTMHEEEMKENDFREIKLKDKLDTQIMKRRTATERRKAAEAENFRLAERLKIAEAEAHAFKLQRLRIEQAEALAKLGKYVGLEAREQTLNKLQRRLAETRDFLERERALTRETVQELAQRNSTLMVQVKKLATSLKGARTEQAELLSNQLMDVSNFSNHLINKLDESVLLELKVSLHILILEKNSYRIAAPSSIVKPLYNDVVARIKIPKFASTGQRTTSASGG